MELKAHQQVALQELRNEIWADVRGWDDYQVSNYGQVYSWKSNRLLTHQFNNGYARVFFTVNYVIYGQMVHRLVAAEFCPGWDYGLEVNHRDGDKLNNHESNLEWVTARENTQHAITTGLRRSKKGAVGRYVS